MQRNSNVVGSDIAKRVLHLVGLDERGKSVMRTRCSRGEVLPLLANLGPITIGKEACGGAHAWARHWREQGHEVTRMAPQSVFDNASLKP
jgi:transposase